MNERIKELAEQAGGIQHDEDGDELTPILVGKDLEKFAELIVRECAVVAHNTAEGETTYGWMVGNKIKEHFGVEE